MAAKTQDAAGETVAWLVIGIGDDIAEAVQVGMIYASEDAALSMAGDLNEKHQDYTICPLYRAATPRETAIAAPTGETVSDVDVVQNYVVKTVKTVSDRADALIALGRIRDELLAARVPAPIAEPEIMALARRVIEAWESPDLSVRDFDKSLTVLRDALAEFDHYSTGGRDADK